MSYGAWSLVIFLTFAVGMLGIWVLLDRGNAELDRLQQLARVEEGIDRTELPRAGLLPVITPSYPVPSSEVVGPYGPWPVDTGPLLILSESDAANEELELYTQDLIAEAEAKIPPRWR